ncbi:hypothetical protein [Pedobacter nototheniae]|uniref:hypothetical protein n=1 Tax=Pedobacter nototheniae TaxID=2488994 RepID=UPI0029304386|nr:hypothetical protein [Pedobacter nototheniae]
MKNLKESQKLSRAALKNVMGGGKIPPAGCSCFCYIGNVKSNHSCTTYCADGSIPGLESGADGGSGADCGTPKPLN